MIDRSAVLRGLLLSGALLLSAFSRAEDRVADVFGDWTKVCSPAGDTEVCQISQVVDNAESNQRLFQTVIGYVPESENPVMFLTAPLGMYLLRGITLELTEDTLMTVAVQRCTANGCLAVSALEPEFVAAMKAGKEARLIFGSTAEQNMTVPFSLMGLTAAMASISPVETSAEASTDAPTESAP
ncbi:MAG: invasion protein IalB [Candidatus Azotimanducaceae bacterium]|jgi:invasion protein IalB